MNLKDGVGCKHHCGLRVFEIEACNSDVRDYTTERRCVFTLEIKVR